jgi:hypothetical protein
MRSLRGLLGCLITQCTGTPPRTSPNKPSPGSRASPGIQHPVQPIVADSHELEDTHWSPQQVVSPAATQFHPQLVVSQQMPLGATADSRDNEGLRYPSAEPGVNGYLPDYSEQ